MEACILLSPLLMFLPLVLGPIAMLVFLGGILIMIALLVQSLSKALRFR